MTSDAAWAAVVERLNAFENRLIPSLKAVDVALARVAELEASRVDPVAISRLRAERDELQARADAVRRYLLDRRNNDLALSAYSIHAYLDGNVDRLEDDDDD